MSDKHSEDFLRRLFLESPENGEELRCCDFGSDDGVYWLIVEGKSGQKWKHTVRTTEIEPAKEF